MNSKDRFIAGNPLIFSLWIFISLFPFVLNAQTSTLVRLEEGKLIYRADEKGNRIPDFSGVGYKNSEVPIPDVPVVLEVSPVTGDNRSQIQDAIRLVAGMPLQANGFRGAIKFRKGTYDISSSLTIHASGIVLRGEGDSTLFRATGENKKLCSPGRASRLRQWQQIARPQCFLQLRDHRINFGKWSPSPVEHRHSL